jgi:eukaryotic-like serine/threonine-protein kinase
MSVRLFLGRYETIRLLGEGGMGKVYLARQVDLGRQVVVKVMHEHIAQDERFRERFQREMLLMARFQHPYVVALFDASLSDPQGPCIVMEYIRGITLDVLLRRNGRLTPARADRLLGQLCEALHAAHAEAIVHRDLKPANLMVVDPDTPYEKIKVMDFGLAKLVENGAGQSMLQRTTQTGVDFAVGTPGYISPEQVRGDPIDFRCDVYSVGVMLYELLTGRLPFVRAETMDVLFAHATETPPSFDDMGASGLVPEEVEAVVRRTLSKDPASRPGGARDLAQQFHDAMMMAHSGPIPEGGYRQYIAQAATPPAHAQAQVETPPPQAHQTPTTYDPNAVRYRMEAWMPDAIAGHKLRGFVHDQGGEVLESVPGRVRVRLGTKGEGGALSWLVGLRRKLPIVDLELLLERNNPQQMSQLQITVLMTTPDRKATVNTAWRDRCTQIFCELRSYLAGAAVG